MWGKTAGNGCIAMTDKLHGSTGSKGPSLGGLTPTLGHDNQADTHLVVLEGIGEAEIPGAVPLQKIVVDGRTFTHVGDDDQGRWVYRPL